MASSYRAVIDGDHVRWIDSPPAGSGAVEVRITVVGTDHDRAERRKAARAALEGLAAQDGITGIEDPAAWQREARSDRVLPGRES
jgi:hypothetical protein